MVRPAPLALLVPLVLQVPLARVRLSVPASVAPCILPAPLLSQAAVRRWLDAPAWARVPVVRLVQAVCLVVPPLVLRLLEPLLAPVPE
jgi:hypothetical protein